MQWLTDDLRERLLENGRRMAEHEKRGEQYDPVPQAYVRLYGPSGAEWLIAALDPNDPDVAYALCQLFGQRPELGYVRVSELAKLKGVNNTPVREDELWREADRLTLSEYIEIAKYTHQITLQFTEGV